MPIKYLFHLSDIHIRNGDIIISRFNEYKNVLNNLFISIKNNIINLHLSKKDFLIIITGDIFHNKNNIGNYGLMLYKILIENLTNIGLTIILEGNHDSIQHELTQPSLVTSTINIDNLIVLRESKSFVIDDLGFSYVNIRDTLDNYSTSGRKNILEPFPIINENVKHKIALFHGTFANVKLYNGTNITSDSNPYPFEWIEDFDFALLGDIHLRQSNYYKKKLLWCYSGSVIQQNFGEDIIDHGYVIWDLDNNNIIEKNVLNDLGKIILKEFDEKIYFKKTNNYIELEKFIYENIYYFPKKLEIKFLTKFNFDNFNFLMNKYKISYNIISNNITENISNKLFTDTLDNSYNFFDKDNFITFFKQHLNNKQYLLLNDIIKNYDTLLFNIDDYPIELHNDCLKKNKELSVLINNCILYDDTNIKYNKFIIKYLEWNNLFCYSNKSWIDFSNLSNSTFIISGKNGTGKSAIYDILTLSIWNDITKTKQNDISSGIINFNSNSAYTIVDIYNYETTYRIKKIYTRKKDNNNLIKISTEIYKIVDDNLILLKKDNASKQLINELFGTIEQFLSSSMITQNFDYNILKMNYKDCTELIDNATNIQYIYNLYNLFKNSLNKYKDFNKIIYAKKNVYNSMINSYNSDFDKINIIDTEEKLKKLLIEKNKLNIILNNIYINTNNDNDIISIDYDSLIHKLNKIIITSDLEYQKKLEEYNELKVFFKNNNINQNDMNKYNNLFNNNIKYDKTIKEPCNLSFIENEKIQLYNYFDFIDNYEDYSILDLEYKLNSFNLEYSNLQNELELINNNKPNKIVKPNVDFNYISKIILKNFTTIQNFINFANFNKFNENYFQNDDTFIFTINFKNYENNKIDIIYINNKIEDLNNKINIINKNNIDLIKLNNINVNKPETYIQFKNSKTIKKYINIFSNIDNLIKFNKNNQNIVDLYYIDINKINVLTNNINYCQTELELIKNNDEYNYDPKCSFCCNRPWVININKLENNIYELNNEILNIKKGFKNINYIIKKYNKNKDIINKFNLYTEWYNFYLYIENKKKIEKNLKTIETYKELIYNLNKESNKLNLDNYYFFNLSNSLYNIYNNYNYYLNYIKWSDNYNNIKIKCQDIDINIISIKKHIDYLKNIKPRIDYYNKIKKNYELWRKNNDNLIIVNSNKFLSIQNDISQYELYINYTNYNKNKKNIIEKNKINNQIIKIDLDIININNIISKYDTINNYNNTNLNSFNKLLNIENKINDIINIISTIIDKFKDYKKWLYNNHILKKIIYNTNNFIKFLCHTDTKKFELDYILTENKDIIHINWLIKNKTINNTIQTISINQASGFQHFVISVSLRLSLFNNKFCDQLFIDEGFTACDKYNLSIVPDFLNNLLKMFNTIIIVSHIDLIQDSIDDKIHIKYNDIDKSSIITYGKCYE